MLSKIKLIISAVLLLLALPGTTFAHGDVQPQAVDTTGLEPLGDEWQLSNPYSGN